MKQIKRHIALIAHDEYKKQMLDWAEYNKLTLSKHSLCATGTTGKLLKEKTGLNIDVLASGPLGGDQMIGSKIAEGKIDLVIFFWNPLSNHVHGDDIRALLRLCVLYNIPLACNKTTADFIISSPLFSDAKYKRDLPSHDEYLNRNIVL